MKDPLNWVGVIACVLIIWAIVVLAMMGPPT